MLPHKEPKNQKLQILLNSFKTKKLQKFYLEIGKKINKNKIKIITVKSKNLLVKIIINFLITVVIKKTLTFQKLTIFKIIFKIISKIIFKIISKIKINNLTVIIAKTKNQKKKINKKLCKN